MTQFRGLWINPGLSTSSYVALNQADRADEMPRFLDRVQR
jgi:hypothetical protein